MIFGHSIGVLWVLHTLFKQPTAFNHYIASSPSIWFSDRYILKETEQFIEQSQKTTLTKLIDLSISVGEFEQSLTGKESFSSEREKELRLAHLKNRRMVNNSKEFAARLSKANIANLNLYYQIYLGQTHQTVADKVLSDQISRWLQSINN